MYIIDAAGNRKQVDSNYRLQHGERLFNAFADHAAGGGNDRTGDAGARTTSAFVHDGRQLAGYRPGFLYPAGSLICDSERIRQFCDQANAAYAEKCARLATLWKRRRDAA